MVSHGNRYEHAFENYLAENRVSFVPVNQQHRADFRRDKIKSFDFLVHPCRQGEGPHVVIAEVKGKLFKGASLAGLKGLEAVYARHDLERIPAAGAPFDPQLHEAVLTEESLDHPPGTIVREIAPGFRAADGRVVRPARVSVARR